VTVEEPWERLVRAEQAHIEPRTGLFASDAEAQLAAALGNPRGRNAALRVLEGATDELKMAMLPSLFDLALATHGNVGLVRTIIGSLDDGWLTIALRPHVNALFERPQVTWEEYRRVAELLRSIGQIGLLDTVVNKAQQSDDLDIREVAGDFRSW